MKQSVLIYLVGIIAGTCCACSPPPPLAASSVRASPAATTCAGDPSGAYFASSVKMLTIGYTPQQLGTPTGNTLVPNPSPIYADLMNAFAIAPPFFQTQLCALGGVYVDQTPCTFSSADQDAGNQPNCAGFSWGFRNQAAGTAYIALSQNLWLAPGSSPPNYQNAPSFSSYENNILSYLLGLPAAPPFYY